MKLIEYLNNNNIVDKNGQYIKEQITGLDELGNSIDIDSITYKSGKKLLWKCKYGHTWSAKVLHRISCRSGCPTCSRIISKNKDTKIRTNDLYSWCLNNGERGKQLQREFRYLVDNNSTDMKSVSYGSSKRAMWECDKGHTWDAIISSRTRTKCNCPYCAGSKVLYDKNDLYSWCEKNNKNLINQFVGTDCDGNEIDIHKVAYASHTKVMWRHITNNGEEHVWSASIRHRTLNNSKCPYCNGSKKVLSGFNDLESWCNRNESYGNIIKEQWTGFDINGNYKYIDKIAAFSGINMLWSHLYNDEVHEWYSTVYNRTTHKTLCPLCNKSGTSLPEQIIYRALKQVYPHTISRGKYRGYEFDITIPEIKTCIEYDSEYYHIGREQHDKEKENICKQCGVKFIRIIGVSNPSDEKVEDGIIAKYIGADRINSINSIVKILCTHIDIKYKDINFDKAVEDTLNFFND